MRYGSAGNSASRALHNYTCTAEFSIPALNGRFTVPQPGVLERRASYSLRGPKAGGCSLSRDTGPALLAQRHSLRHRDPRRNSRLSYVTRAIVTDKVPPSRQQWQLQKDALKKKFGAEKWVPRKKLSPDALEGVRKLHAQDPEKYSTEALAAHFKVSPEAIRRILKSKWRPSEDELAKRQMRWINRGKRIWSSKMSEGMKPPRRWREMINNEGPHQAEAVNEGRYEGRRRTENQTGLDIEISKQLDQSSNDRPNKGAASLSHRIL